MKLMIIAAALGTILGMNLATVARADVLPPAKANEICRAKALKAAHFIMETPKKFVVTYKASDIAEISTPITYEFYYKGINDSIVTVHAYAYPDDQSCLIGVISNNIAGND